MVSYDTLGEVIGELVMNVNPKREPLYLQILAVKCYYFARSIDACLLSPQDISFLLAVWSHFFIRPYVQQSLFTSLPEFVIVALPYLRSDYGYLTSCFMLLVVSCFIHPALEFAVDLCLILNFSNYSYRVFRGNEPYRDDLRWEIIAMMFLLPDLSIEKLFRAVIFVLCCNAFIQPTSRKLENILFLTLIALEINYTLNNILNYLIIYSKL
ncbi:hypothetical protein AVEN_35131-1 [Araneus ventricosus]|uniref:Uncharacterized protein n=1 Tax=Araneus ventricosus TaxID=182803 RepID=A0A4Y2PQE2_ARAVE|nr:hypothetical protein AVEN_4164-1 [Araneus ventricosus]GBN54544.1 hypothetical protein AVEN_35131-1 [Araneus ventricosus]